MEVACGEHGEAVDKLVKAVNIENCRNDNLHAAQENLLTVMQANEKMTNSLRAASSSVEPSSQVMIRDSVIVDIDLVKGSSNNEYSNPSEKLQNEVQPIGPASSLLDSSTESVIVTEKDYKHHINGFPTSSWTQFWILLKRTFLTIIRDQTLTQMRLVVSNEQ